MEPVRFPPPPHTVLILSSLRDLQKRDAVSKDAVDEALGSLDVGSADSIHQAARVMRWAMAHNIPPSPRALPRLVALRRHVRTFPPPALLLHLGSQQTRDIVHDVRLAADSTSYKT